MRFQKIRILERITLLVIFTFCCFAGGNFRYGIFTILSYLYRDCILFPHYYKKKNTNQLNCLFYFTTLVSQQWLLPASIVEEWYRYDTHIQRWHYFDLLTVSNCRSSCRVCPTLRIRYEKEWFGSALFNKKDFKMNKKIFFIFPP